MPLRPDFDDDVRSALEGPAPDSQLLELARTEIKGGTTASDILNAFESLRPGLEESDEERVLEVMDVLVGWCGPNARIDIDKA
jgi:hypothetical protein